MLSGMSFLPFQENHENSALHSLKLSWCPSMDFMLGSTVLPGLLKSVAFTGICLYVDICTCFQMHMCTPHIWIMWNDYIKNKFKFVNKWVKFNLF